MLVFPFLAPRWAKISEVLVWPEFSKAQLVSSFLNTNQGVSFRDYFLREASVLKKCKRVSSKCHHAEEYRKSVPTNKSKTGQHTEG